MINTSNEYKTAILKNRIMYADVKMDFVNGQSVQVSQEKLRGLSIEDNVSGTSSFDIGSAISGQLTLKLDNMDGIYDELDFFGAEITVRIGLQLSNSIEWLNKGIFTADSGEDSGAILTVKAYDNMLKFDRSYAESKLVYPATLSAIVRDACDICGVHLSTASFNMSDYTIQNRPDDETLTFREVLCWVGQIACLWCRCDAYGALKLGFYDLDGYENETGHFFDIQHLASASISTDDVVITGVKVAQEGEDGTVEYLSGQTGYVLTVEGNGLIQGAEGQTIADLIGEKLIGLRFRKLSVSHRSDPSMEAGDLAKITTRKGKVYKTLVTGTNYQFGNNQKTECGAETPSRNTAERYSQQTKNYVATRKLIQKEQTIREEAIKNLANTLANSSGLYLTEEPQENSSTIYYAHNKPTLEESDVVWKFTAEAIGISTDGGKTYPYGFMVTGEMITKILQTEGLSAEWITSGAFQITDNDGNEVFYADKDTGEVRINAQSIRIGGVGVITYDDLQNVKNELADAAKALNIILSNDFHGIPVDSDGNNPVYDGCGTTVKVLLGEENISDAVTYSITKSSGLTGTWDLRLRTYTVTGLEVDSGWVDITASYLTMTVTKRFSVAKIKGGEPGTVILMETNASVVKQSDMGMNPNSLIYHAYTRQGDGARQDYAGYFKVEETRNGLDWRTIYTSATAEPSVTHHLYTLLEAKPGGLITSVSGAVIGVWRPISEVRCTLYADAALTVPLEISVATVIKDVDALTQDQVFNILTNNGETMGVYKVGNTLWINANYIRAGLLTDLKGMNFWNLNTGEFSLSSTATAGGKTIANQEDTKKQLQDAVDAVNNSISDVDKKINMEKVFDLWFENASRRGIMMDSNGRLYISFDMARGEILKLGGQNNGNGELRVYDAAGNQIGYWTKDGFYAQEGTFAGTLSGADGTFNGTMSAGKVQSSEVIGSTITGSMIKTETQESTYSSIEMSNGNLSFKAGEDTYNSEGSGTISGEFSSWMNEYGEVAMLGAYALSLYSPDLLTFGVNSQRALDISCMPIELGISTLVAVYCRVPFYASGDIACNGTKSRLVETEHHGRRLQYCYETPTPMFGDIGTGQTDETGICYVSIDDIFSETVNCDVEYSVFLQREGPGDIWVDSKESAYFVVKGSPNLPFSWELKAVQRDFETRCLDDFTLIQGDGVSDPSDLTQILDKELIQYDREMEEILNENFESVPGD